MGSERHLRPFHRKKEQVFSLTISNSFRILLTRVASEKALPIEPLIPSQEAIDALVINPHARWSNTKCENSIFLTLINKRFTINQ